MELYTDNTLRQTLAAPPFSFLLDTTVFDNGDHTIRVLVYDTILQTSTASVAVVADNIFAPGGLKAVKAVNRSLLLREYVNVLTWTDDARNTNLWKYRVYRITGAGRELIAEMDKALTGVTYRYVHRRTNPSETYVYEVVGTGPLDREGLSATVTAR